MILDLYCIHLTLIIGIVLNVTLLLLIRSVFVLTMTGFFIIITGLFQNLTLFGPDRTVLDWIVLNKADLNVSNLKTITVS